MISDAKVQTKPKPIPTSSASSSDESPEKPMKNSKKPPTRTSSDDLPSDDNSKPLRNNPKQKKRVKSSSSSSSSEDSKEESPKQLPTKKHNHKVKFVKISRLKDSLRPYIRDEDDEGEPEEEKLFTKLSLGIEKFREGIIGRNVLYESPFGGKIITLYADDTASGRPHDIVENYIRSILPIYANTHSDNSYFPVSMHLIYKDSIKYMKDIFKTPKNYELIGVGTGCTGAIFRFQQILLQKYGESLADKENPPVCFVTEYEHHSNLLSWQKFGFELLPIKHTARNSWAKGLKNLEQQLLSKLHSPLIVIALSAASNVTSQITPLSQVADFLQKFKQANKTPPIIWLLDLAAYVPHARLNITELKVDAVVISPHKLTGGPGSCGILIFNTDHYNPKAPPTHPAGGTVSIVHNYNKEDVVFADDILERESAGTPGILQLIRAKEAFALQDKIGLNFIESREKQLKEKLFDSVREMNLKWEKKKSSCKIEILGTHKVEERSSVFSVVFFDNKGKIYHYHLIQRILNDIFGIQLRSGCNCAGPFGVKLLEKIFKLKENMPQIIEEIKKGNTGIKPGWVRFNVHYSFTDEDMEYLIFALKFVTENGRKIANQYYEETNGDYHINSQKRYALNPDLNQLDENSLKRIEVKEIKEAKRNNYLKKIMNCVNEFLKN